MKKSSPTISPCGIELYYTLGGLGVDVKKEFERVGFQRVILLTQRRIVDAEDQWTIDEERFSNFVERQISVSDLSPQVALNWEGEVYKAIQKGPTSPDYVRATMLFIKAYKIVKKLRPNAIVGYYGFPIRDYWNRNEKWKEKNRTLDAFLSNFDVLYPSIYDFYDSNTSQGRGDLEYVRENVEEAILMGQRIKKPVMPFVWHRYHTSNKKKSLQLIPVEEFTDHIGSAASTEIKGKHIDGLIWWGSEYSSYARANKAKFANKVLLRAAWEEESVKILPVYFDALLAGIERACPN